MKRLFLPLIGIFLSCSANADVTLNTIASGQLKFSTKQIRSAYIRGTGDAKGVYLRLEAPKEQIKFAGELTEVYISESIFLSKGIDMVQFGRDIVKSEIDIGLYANKDPIFSRDGKHATTIQAFDVGFKIPRD